MTRFPSNRDRAPRPSGHCPLCGTWRRALERDHIVPVFKSGTNAPENIQFICANCHQDKTFEDYQDGVFGERVGAALRGKKRAPFSQEWRDKIAAKHRGVKEKPFSATHRARLSIAMRKRRITPEHKYKLDEARRRRALRDNALRSPATLLIEQAAR